MIAKRSKKPALLPWLSGRIDFAASDNFLKRRADQMQQSLPFIDEYPIIRSLSGYRTASVRGLASRERSEAARCISLPVVIPMLQMFDQSGLSTQHCSFPIARDATHAGDSVEMC
ncbi:hypothetical protein [Roseiconus lacunae]|uniref:Uncharacterized protein n=1 Tax=Roseiconus lacunae TaxID=2605694 RepID=A0ABT7PS46_9BACT|nr:hypothetical protein [Roseiconus lacunae]MDM4019323.1 hypothetical protein [Roseiconus lacunae]